MDIRGGQILITHHSTTWMDGSIHILCILLLSVLNAFTQQTSGDTHARNTDVFKLGARSVRVPPPEGFIDVVGRVVNDHGRFAANEREGLISLCVRTTDVPALDRDPLMPLDIYTKVRIAPEMISMDVDAELYAKVVAEYQKNFDSLLDPNGSVVAKAKKDLSLNVSQITGRISIVDLKSSRNLGYFQKTERVFSSLSLMTIEVNGQPIPLLVSVSLLRLNDRLVNVAVYKRLPTDSDIDYLRAFTTRWTSAIVAANP